MAFQSTLPAGCFIFNTCSTLELSHRFLWSLVTVSVVLFLPEAEKCQHSTENFNIPTVQQYLLKSSLRHWASARSVLFWLYISLFTTHIFWPKIIISLSSPKLENSALSLTGVCQMMSRLGEVSPTSPLPVLVRSAVNGTIFVCLRFCAEQHM